jgi:TonB family protein
MTMLICLISLLIFTPLDMTLTTAFQNSSASISEDEDYAEGIKAFNTRDFQKAIERFNHFATRKPKEFHGRYFLGLSYRGAKQYDEAIAALQRAADIQPNPPFARYEIGKTFLEMKNYEAALREYQWLQEKSEELAAYLLDLMPQELAEQYHLPPSSARPFVQVKKESDAKVNSAPQSETDKGNAPSLPPQQMTASLRPVILYRERAKYTEIARLNMAQGAVVMSIVYTSGGEIRDIRVIRGLPDGLTRSAIEAVKKIRFNPAIKDGQPVSVRGNVEFNFTLY